MSAARIGEFVRIYRINTIPNRKKQIMGLIQDNFKEVILVLCQCRDIHPGPLFYSASMVIDFLNPLTLH
jgi:hypothetical protein